MKSLSLFITFLFFFVLSTKAQEQENVTYRIVDNGSATNVQAYINALNKSNMKYHRLKNTRHIITFDTGVKVELFSATELIAAGKTIVLADYPESFDPQNAEPIFLLGQNDYILEPRTNKGKSH